MIGDGAFGFSGMEFDTLARHGVNIVAVMGNNGIWALEKHPMEFLYGYSVAAELRPETRYDEVVEALGGYGELVSSAQDVKPGVGARVLVGQAGAGERADRSERRLPAQVKPRLSVGRPAQSASRRRPFVVRVQPTPARRSAPPCRMSCSETSTCSSSNDAERLFEHDHASDDRRRAVGVQADDLTARLFVHVGQAREQQFDGAELQVVAVDAFGVIRVERLIDRRRRGGGAGDGDAARHLLALGGRQAVQKRLANVRGEALKLLGRRRIGVDVTLAHAHDAGLQ